MTPEQTERELRELSRRIDELQSLQKGLSELRDAFYSNNFPTSQDFPKYCRFNGRLKVPHYDSLPATCEVGEVAESSGKLRICSAANTWTIVGTQS